LRLNSGDYDLVLRILKEIQSTLAEHGRRFEQVDRRFDRIDQRLDEIHEGVITSLGLAGHAHVRHHTMQKEIDNIKKRLKRLEEKV
jgi:tetrahydromethanopterin S-methyltransferase subunit G